MICNLQVCAEKKIASNKVKTLHLPTGDILRLVQMASSVSDVPSAQETHELDVTVTVICFCSNSRPQRVNWVKVDDDVPTHAVITGSDLYIENLNKSYNGTYRCVASNPLGESYDDYILYVYGKLIYGKHLCNHYPPLS